MNKFDQFCRKYERYGVKNLMTIVVAGQGILGLLCLLLSMTDSTRVFWIFEALSFNPDAFLQGQVWRLITFVFIPETLLTLQGGLNLIWFALSLLFYFWVGRSLESAWGRLKLTIYYFSGALLSVGFSLILWLTAGIAVTANLFYLNLSLFFAMATIMSDMQIRLYFLIPIKIKYVALVQAAIYIVLPFLQWSSFPANLLPLLSILNYLFFFRRSLWELVSRTPGRIKNSRRTVQFKSEVRRTKANRGYIHKCDVCGCTDADLPDMEFRYCSLCAGYACYCSDHIFNHPHKTVR